MRDLVSKGVTDVSENVYSHKHTHINTHRYSHTDVHTHRYIKQNTRAIYKQVPTTDNSQNRCRFLESDRNVVLSRDTRTSDLTGLLKAEGSYTTSGDLVFRKGEEISTFAFMSPFDWPKGCPYIYVYLMRQPVEEVMREHAQQQTEPRRASLFSGRGWKDDGRCKPSRLLFECVRPVELELHRLLGL